MKTELVKKLKIGQKVVLRLSHPHGGEHGQVVGFDNLVIFGRRPRVRLSDCKHGVEECFIMEDSDFKKDDD